MTIRTGNGSTASGIVSGRFKQIGSVDRSIGKNEIEATDVEGEKEYQADDLIEPGEVEFEVYYDGTPPPSPGDSGAQTVQYAGGGGWTADCFVLSASQPMAKNGELMMFKVKLQISGKTPKFAASAATQT